MLQSEISVIHSRSSFLFRRSLDHFFCGNDGSNDNPEYYHWMNDFDKSRAFLNHTKIVMFAQTNGGPNEEEGNTQDTKNLCKDVDD